MAENIGGEMWSGWWNHLPKTNSLQRVAMLVTTTEVTAHDPCTAHYKKWFCKRFAMLPVPMDPSITAIIESC